MFIPLILILGISFFVYRRVNKNTKIENNKEKEILDNIENKLRNLEKKKDSYIKKKDFDIENRLKVLEKKIDSL